MYRNTNTNRALRDLNAMVRDIPESRSRRDLRSARAEGENLRAMAGLKQAELALPGMQLQSQKAQDTLDRHNAPFNPSQLFGNVQDPILKKNGYVIQNTPGQAGMWVQEQKNGNPPAIQQALENIEYHYGYKLNNDGTAFVDKNGAVVPNRLAAPILDEVRRVRRLNMDPLKARDERAAILQDVLSSGQLSDQDMKTVQAKLDQLNNLDEIDLRESYLSALLKDQAYREQNGMQSNLAPVMIKEQQDKIGELKAARVKSGDRAFEIARDAQKQAATARQKELDRASRERIASKSDDSMDYFVKQRLADISESIKERQNILAKGTMVENDIEVPMTPEYQARLQAEIGQLYAEADNLRGGSVDRGASSGVAAPSNPPAGESSAPERTVAADLESNPQAVEIRDRMRRGEITREQAKQMIMGGEQPPQPKAPEKQEPPTEKKESRGSYTNPPEGMPIVEALNKMGVGKENWKALAKDAATLGGFALNEFYQKPVNEIMRWLKKAYSAEGRKQARESIQ